VLDRKINFAALRSLALALCVFTLGGCSGALFKVKPVVELPALPSTANSADAGGVVLRIAPLLTDEESQELFEANLPLGGLLPLRIELSYKTGGVPLELKRVHFHLHDGTGREWKLLTPKQAISQILKSNGVTLYNPHSRKQFEKEFTAYAIDLKTPLAATERRRQGFLFFKTPDKTAVSSPRGLTLAVEGLPQPVEIRLN
jgi:hypothetical protein